MTTLPLARLDTKRNRVTRARRGKQRTHTFAITVTFDRKCGSSHALREAKECIYGEFYTAQREDNDPGVMRVKKITRT